MDVLDHLLRPLPTGAQTFTKEETENETRGEWYIRQMLGSANIEGGNLFHIMSGNLSHQIEHHLFPDVPANRYPEMSEEVRAICERHGLPYNTGNLRGQLGSTWKKIAKLSLPNSWTRATTTTWSSTSSVPRTSRRRPRPHRPADRRKERAGPDAKGVRPRPFPRPSPNPRRPSLQSNGRITP